MNAGAVLLDLDGTLSDSRAGIEACFRHMLAELGLDPATAGDLTWAVGPPIAVSVARLLAQYDDARVDQGLAVYSARYSSVAIYD
jgi:phosphoglycolate phosphatase